MHLKYKDKVKSLSLRKLLGTLFKKCWWKDEDDKKLRRLVRISDQQAQKGVFFLPGNAYIVLFNVPVIKHYF